jgi:acyl-coenzyme A synthetase/AMP-(fatty) acid ligase
MYSFMVGIMHAGLTAFPISARNSAPAVAQLIKSTGISVLYVSTDDAMQLLAHRAANILQEQQEGTGAYHVEIVPLPTFSEIYHDVDNFEKDVQVNLMKADHCALIVHTSGMMRLA